MNKNPDFNEILAAALAEQNRTTNADRIRAMSDEELARWAWAIQTGIICADLYTTEDWLNWLRKEADNA